MQVRCYRLPASADPEGVRRAALAASPGLLVQAVDESALSGESLAEMLVAQTVAAEASGSLLARKREVDLLLRLGGTTQISAAIGSVGARKGRPFVLMVAGEARDIDAVEARLALSERLPRGELGPRALETVERAALLNAERG